MYCIWLNEYFKALKRAGFSEDIAMGIITDKDSYPDWVNFSIPTDSQIAEHLDEDED